MRGGGRNVNIGQPKRIIEIEPVELPLPALEPVPENEPTPAAPAPLEPAR